eukprot:766724-Hanusia_phi.AAC.4
MGTRLQSFVSGSLVQASSGSDRTNWTPATPWKQAEQDVVDTMLEQEVELKGFNSDPPISRPETC